MQSQPNTSPGSPSHLGTTTPITSSPKPTTITTHSSLAQHAVQGKASPSLPGHFPLPPTKPEQSTPTEKLSIGHAPDAVGGSEDDRKTASLSASIKALWSHDKTQKRKSKQTLNDLRATRDKLSVQLNELKNHLDSVGRSRRWKPTLEALGISRATADRLVKKHLDKAFPEPHKAPTEPTDLQVAARVKAIERKLRDFLRTPKATKYFIGELTAALTRLH